MQHTSDSAPGLRRLGTAKRFRYVDAHGRPVRDAATLSRIRALAIPPAWTDVWIAPHAGGHLQATGRDAKHRKQYRYHPRWRAQRDAVKYDRLVEFCHALPRLRAAIARDLACSCLCKAKVVATVVSLMERAQLRIGNEEYTRANGSYGATTLRDRHAKIYGDTLELAYRGKSGVARRVRVTDRRLARIVRRCRDLPGQRLFQFVDAGHVRPISSSDVNAYVRDVTGGPFTAKDYRTWAGTLGAVLLLAQLEPPDSERAGKRAVKQVLDVVAERLGHTPAVCRASYVHPRVVDDFMRGRLEGIRRQLHRRCGEVELVPETIGVDTLRAIETPVARYLASKQRRRA